MLDETEIEKFVDQVEECWIRLGLDNGARRRLAAALRTDLSDARADLTSIESLLDGDVTSFAVESAIADGHSFAVGRLSAEPANVIPTALGGALFGTMASWFAIYTNYGLYDLLAQAMPQAGAAIVLHLAAALLVLGSVLAATWFRFRQSPKAAAVAGRTSLLVLVGGAVSLLPAIWLAGQSGYRWDLSVVIAETALVGGTIALVLLLGHRYRLIRQNPPRARPAS